MLYIHELAFSYGTSPVLANCMLHVAPGEAVGLIGRNGAGKSTLMKLITGQLDARKGTIRINGSTPDSRPGRLSTFFAASNDYLPPFMTGSEYLDLLANLYGIAVDAKNIEAMYERYGMAGRARNLIEDYSHGMRKKLQIIGSLLAKRPLTLIDETLNGIDVDALLESQKDVRALVDEGGSLLLCSHDFSYLEKTCSRIVMLNCGIIIDEISSDSFANTPGRVESWARSLIHEDDSEDESI